MPASNQLRGFTVISRILRRYAKEAAGAWILVSPIQTCLCTARSHNRLGITCTACRSALFLRASARFPAVFSISRRTIHIALDLHCKESVVGRIDRTWKRSERFIYVKNVHRSQHVSGFLLATRRQSETQHLLTCAMSRSLCTQKFCNA